VSDRITPSGVAIGRQAALSTMQARLALATAELSSGRKADAAGQAGLGASLLYRLHDQVAQGEALNESISLAGKRLEAMQTALTGVSDTLTQLSSATLQAHTMKEASWPVLAAQARDSMATVTDRLNAQFDGQYLFAGLDAASPPLRSPDDATVVAGDAGPLATLSAELSAAVTAAGGPLDATTAAAFVAALQAKFDSAAPTGGFRGIFYTSESVAGDGKPNAVAIGAGETLSYDLRADDPALRKTFLATSLLSLLDAPETDLSAEAKTVLTEQAGNLLREAQGGITQSAGLLGSKQQRLERISDIQSNAMTAAAQQINTLEGVDYAATADRISQLQTQLQATYAITAKLSELSFVNYLR
jgi:flagellin-like hook-associated protein FlgL